MKQFMKINLKKYLTKNKLNLGSFWLILLSVTSNISACSDEEMAAVGDAARDILAREAGRAVSTGPERWAGPIALRREETIGVVAEFDSSAVRELLLSETSIHDLTTALAAMTMQRDFEVGNVRIADETSKAIRVQSRWQRAFDRVKLENLRKKLVTTKVESLKAQACLAEVNGVAGVLRQELARQRSACERGECRPVAVASTAAAGAGDVRIELDDARR